MADHSSSHQLLRVPAEALAQACRKRHKQVEKELESTLGAVRDALSSGESLPAASVDGLVKRLQGLKRKVEDGQAQEEELLQRCRMRLEYVQTMQQRDASPEEREAVRTERLQRLVADYLLREGYDDSARHLAQQAGIEQYLDFEPILASRSVLAALKVRRTCTCSPTRPHGTLKSSQPSRAHASLSGTRLRARAGLVRRAPRQAQEGGLDARAQAAAAAVCGDGAQRSLDAGSRPRAGAPEHRH